MGVMDGHAGCILVRPVAILQEEGLSSDCFVCLGAKKHAEQAGFSSKEANDGMARFYAALLKHRV